MDKRGINPLIVTSILVGLTLVIGVTIFGFGVDIQKSSIESNTYDLEELGLVQFSAYYKDAACEETGTIPAEHFCYRIFIKNNENFPLGFVVQTSSPAGSHISGPDEFPLGPYEQKVFNINYPINLGDQDLYAEVNPVVK